MQELGWVTEPTAEENLTQEQCKKSSLVQPWLRPCDLKGHRCLLASTGSHLSNHGLQARRWMFPLLGQDDPDVLAPQLSYYLLENLWKELRKSL